MDQQPAGNGSRQIDGLCTYPVDLPSACTSSGSLLRDCRAEISALPNWIMGFSIIKYVKEDNPTVTNT
jgi:hypothetical protein